MSKTVSFKNNDRFIQIGIAIVTLRKLRGMSQEKLAEKAGGESWYQPFTSERHRSARNGTQLHAGCVLRYCGCTGS